MLLFLEKVNAVVWGVPVLLLILGVGIYLSIRTGFSQFTLFPEAIRSFLRRFFKKDNSNGVSPFQSLCTALAATVGTGNLAGVAGAIAVGGPGAIFWMWVSAFLGMITKLAEATLAVQYRKKLPDGSFLGGPMYIIEQGMGKRWKFLAVIYCFFALVASFGVGNATQINTVIGGINSVITLLGGKVTTKGNFIIGITLAILITGMLLGGAKRIGETAEKLVPFASIAYLFLGFIVLIGRAQEIPKAFSAIIIGAFSPKAVTGGMLGSAFLALRVGTSRGVFTNEAGMGTASIAHAAANVKHPVEQGLMGIVEVFLDTIVICTMTALVILCSGVSIPYGMDVGINLTSRAFSSVLGDWVCIPLAACLCLFAIATVLGWGLYGARSAQYLFGETAWSGFVFAQGITVIVGSILGTGTVWLFAEIVNGLMAIPNLIALAFLSPELVKQVKQYKTSTAYSGSRRGELFSSRVINR